MSIGTINVTLGKNPYNAKLESDYNGGGVLTITGSGFGTGPQNVFFKSWRDKTPTYRTSKEDFESSLYGIDLPANYPLIYNIDGNGCIGSRNNKPQITLSVVVQNNAVYQLTIGSTPYPYTSTGSATAAEIVSALSTDINGDVNCKAVASGTTTLILTRKNASEPFSISGAGDTVDDVGGPGVNLIHDQYLTGFTKILPDYNSFFAGWKMAVPAGYFFSGASAESTLPTMSSLKMLWVSDQTLDNEGLADIVACSRVSSIAWAMTGNQTAVMQYAASNTFDFGIYNGFTSYHKSGAAPFTDNGTTRLMITNSSGTSTASTTNKPLFIKKKILTFTVVANFTYSIVIDSITCSYTSTASPTIAAIRAGLIADINSKMTGICTANNSAASSSITITADLGILPTFGALSGNITSYELLPKFDRVATIWHGNGNQINCLHNYPYIYFATGNNCGDAVCFANNSVLASATDIEWLNVKSWTDTKTQHYYDKYQIANKTHWFRLSDGLPVASGPITNSLLGL